MASRKRTPPRRVAVLIYPGHQALDAVGPLEVFATAARVVTFQGGSDPYRIELLGPEAGAQLCRSGYGLVAQRSYRDVRGPLDTLLVAGGDSAEVISRDLALQRWLARMAGRTRRVCSVCTGAYLLAAAGLLAGRRATTHWASCKRLQRRYPEVQVEPDPIYIRDGAIYTSAGVTAGIDLALSLVEEDLGAEVARTVARWLVVFLQRPGGQRQFSAQLRAAPPRTAPMRALQRLIEEHPERDLSVPSLASEVGMSPRNFARRFRAELGVTPARYVREVRVELAQRRLEQGDESIEGVATAVGFGTEESMRRAFIAVLDLPPMDYRARFAQRRSA